MALSNFTAVFVLWSNDENKELEQSKWNTTLRALDGSMACRLCRFSSVKATRIGYLFSRNFSCNFRQEKALSIVERPDLKPHWPSGKTISEDDPFLLCSAVTDLYHWCSLIYSLYSCRMLSISSPISLKWFTLRPADSKQLTEMWEWVVFVLFHDLLRFYYRFKKIFTCWFTNFGEIPLLGFVHKLLIARIWDTRPSRLLSTNRPGMWKFG